METRIAKQPTPKKDGHRTPPKGYPADPDMYADPVNFKYPLNTEKHARAAWSYIHQKDNKGDYTADELDYMKSRITKALRRFKVKFTEEVKAETDAASTRTARWSQKYKNSIDCDNPKGFSQRAHCHGLKKREKKSDALLTLSRLAEDMENKGLDKQASELHDAFLRIAEHLHDDEPVVESDYDHELGMIRNQLKNMQRAIDGIMDVIGEHGEGNLPAWVQAMISVSADDLDSVSDYMASEYGHSHGHGMEKEASAHEEHEELKEHEGQEEGDHHENVDDLLDPDYWMEAENSLEDALNNYDAHLYKVDAAGDWNLGKLMEIEDFVQMITRKDEEAMSAPAIVDGNHIVFKIDGMDPQVINLVHADHWGQN